jgi:sugar lactone lactonase YvrE
LSSARPTISSIAPVRAVEGGRLVLHGANLPVDPPAVVTLGGQPVRIAFGSPTRIAVFVPSELDGGRTELRVDGLIGEVFYVTVGERWATGLHQVDNPVFDDSGNLFVTYSGSRGQESPVSIFRVTPEGTREPFVSGIVNATSMARGPDGLLYVSSRFEGAVYRVKEDGAHEQVATDLGVACGLVFGDDGALYVGDRSGTIFRVHEGRTTTFASLPASVAAFHLAMSREQELFVSGPTLGTYDHVFCINRDGHVRSLPTPFGRPQGMAFSPDGVLHVVDALAGASGLYRLAHVDRPPELVVAAPSLIGVAFGPAGALAVCSSDTVYRFQ